MTIRAINQYTLLREKATGRIGQIKSFRLDIAPREVSIFVKFEGQENGVSFTGIDNIIDSFEVVRRVNGEIRTLEMDRLEVLTQADDLEGSRYKEQARTVDENIYLCPNCRLPTTNTSSRKCLNCGYVGDWIQPGETETYAQRVKGKCPCDHCTRGVGTKCYMTRRAS